MSDKPILHGRQRQRKGYPLKTLKAKVSPETYAWLNHIAGEASIGVALDWLEERFSTLSGPRPHLS